MRHTLTAADRLMIVEVTFGADVAVGEHPHHEEKSGCVISGRIPWMLGKNPATEVPADP